MTHPILPPFVLTKSICLFSLCWTLLPQGFSQEPGTRVVARRNLNLSGQTVAQAGDLLTVERRDGDQIVVSTASDTLLKIDPQHVANLVDGTAVLTTLIETSPEESRLYLMRSNLWAMHGFPDKTLQDITKAIELSADKDATVYVSRGVFYMSGHQVDEAIADFLKATRIAPKSPAAYAQLASAWLAKKEYDDAIAACNNVIKIDPGNAVHYVQRGVAHRFKEDWDEAIADFTQALEIDPDSLAAVSSRGFVYYLKGDHVRAIADFDQVIQRQPENAMAYNNRGFNRQQLGHYEQALADYRKAVSLNPDYAMALQNTAWLLATCPDSTIRDGQAAVTAATKACKIRNNTVASDIKALAAACAESGDFETAVEHQARVVAMINDDGKQQEQNILAIYQAGQPFRSPAKNVPASNSAAAAAEN